MKPGNNVGAEIKEFVDRLELLYEAKDAALADIKSVYEEAKETGLNVRIMRKVMTRVRRGREKVREEDDLLEMYEGYIFS